MIGYSTNISDGLYRIEFHADRLEAYKEVQKVCIKEIDKMLIPPNAGGMRGEENETD